MLIFCSLFALLVTAGRTSPLNSSFENVTINEIPRHETNYRLPKTVIPSHYDLLLDPNFVQFNFQGETAIDIKVLEKVDVIIVHAQNLTIDRKFSMLLDNSGNKTGNSYNATYFPKTDFYMMQFDSPVPIGHYKLKFKYTGLLHDDLFGFYRSSYINEVGDKVWLATTKFEATFARRAFPCFDEPAFKATFKIRIRHPDNYTAISNMPAISQTRPNNDLFGWETEFETTPLMSTYLVAFVISDFKYLSKEKGDFRIYANSHQIKSGKYALEIGLKAFKALIDYTKIDVGVPKMDNVAIPDFSTGAMENWGLVTYKESSLLLQKNEAFSYQKQEITEYMSHEFAHQWFGNLITPLWWDYVWISEGLANYFQYFISNKIEPTGRYMDKYVVEILQIQAFSADDCEETHAMDTTVNSPTEIKDIFDGITYCKAGCVIRMFSHVISESNFQDGLQKYLANNVHKSVASDALIDSLIAVAPKGGIYEDVDLKLFFESWVEQPGFPVITVIRNYTSGEASITQKRFLTIQTKPPTESWIIPTNYVTEDNFNFTKTAPTLWIPSTNIPTVIENLQTDKWVIFNVQQTGYYRVNYDSKNWKMIADYMKDREQMKKIHLLNRAQLLDDSFKLAEAGELPDYSAFLAITEYLKNEVDPIPWYNMGKSLLKIKKNLANTKSFHLFKLYVRSLIKKLEQSFSYEESIEDDSNTFKNMNRENIINLACSVGSKKCLESAHAQLLEYLQGSKKFSSDLENTILNMGMRSANETTWQKVYNLAVQNSDKSKQSQLMSALGCSSNKEIIKKYLESSLNESNLLYNAVIYTVVYSNSFGADLAFEFIRNNINSITKQKSYTLSSLIESLAYIALTMTTENQLSKLKEWIKTLATEEHKDLVTYMHKDGFAYANRNIQWVMKHEPVISKFLKSQKLIEVDENKTSKEDLNSRLVIKNLPVTSVLMNQKFKYTPFYSLTSLQINTSVPVHLGFNIQVSIE